MTPRRPRSQATPSPTPVRPIGRKLTDPLTAVAVVAYVLALAGLCLNTNAFWPALPLGLGVALLSGIVVVATRRHTPRPVDIVRSRIELWLILAWYGIVVLLATATSAIQLELVNQFTNWFFLVIVPFGLLLIVRGRGLALRATLRSIGVTRLGLKDGLKLSAIIVPLSIPVLYVAGDQQRAAVELILYEPFQALVFSCQLPTSLVDRCICGRVLFPWCAAITPRTLHRLRGTRSVDSLITLWTVSPTDVLLFAF